MKLLVVDIGNTTTKAGVWDGHAIGPSSSCPTQESGELLERVSQLAAAVGHDGTQKLDVALCSVVPEAEKTWLAWCEHEGRTAFVVRGDTPTPLVNRYLTPARLGPDRLATAVAATQRFGVPVIAACVGTAIFVDAVSANNEYLGGAIWVGMAAGLSLLAQRAKTLPQVTIKPPSTAIGGETEACLHAGAIYGTAGLIDALASKMKETIGEDAPLVLTGGNSELLSHYLNKAHEVVPTLTLEGVATIWEHNHRKVDADR